MAIEEGCPRPFVGSVRALHYPLAALARLTAGD